MIRILGIALDNAIEASKDNPASSKIDMMIYLNNAGGLEFEIRNLLINHKISMNQIRSNGYTTKANHFGIGLSNVEEIVSQYSGIALDLHVEGDYFVFYLVIDGD